MLSAFVGGVTHVIWDAFTHPDWVVDSVGVLRIPLGPLSLDHRLQHASTVGGIVALAIWGLRRARRAPRDPARPSRFTRVERVVTLTVIAVAVVLGGVIPWSVGIARGSAPFAPDLVFAVACVLVAAGSAATVLAAIAWHLLRRRA